jgi:single-strand DNA-binding protein
MVGLLRTLGPRGVLAALTAGKRGLNNMSDLNRVTIVGRLTRDAELKYTSGGMAVCKFSIAVNRKKKNGDEWVDEASFFDIVLWGRQGEAINQYLVKGKQIGVDGELRQERWQDRDSGQARSKVEIVASNIQLLGGGNNNGGDGSDNGNYGGGSRGGNERGNSGDRRSGSYSNNRSNGAAQSQGRTRQNDDGFTDDIPF